MSAASETPAPVVAPAPRPAAQPAPPGGRGENALLWLQLLGDLGSNPFHFVLFLCTANRQRRALQRALTEAAS